MRNFREVLEGKTRPSQAALQDQTRRANLQPAISASQDTADAGLATPPIGASMRWWSNTVPADGRWMIEDGALLKVADYPDLYLILGTTFNTGGEAADEFRLPDSRGRSGVGAGSALPGGLSNRVLGVTHGAEDNTLTIGQLPAHDHSSPTGANGAHGHGGNTANAPAHNHGGDTQAGSAHNHTYIEVQTEYSNVNLAGGGTDQVSGHSAVRDTGNNTSHTHGIPNEPAHNHSITAAVDHTHTIASQGSGNAHNNMQPSINVRYIIRVLL